MPSPTKNCYSHMIYSIDDVKIELYNLLKQGTCIFLSARLGNQSKNSDLPELLRKCFESTSQDLRLYSSLVNGYREEINRKIEELDEEQLEHFATLIRYYKEGLENVRHYSKDNQTDYFLSLPENLAIDVGKYNYREEAMVKKKFSNEPSKGEVPEMVTSFFL